MSTRDNITETTSPSKPRMRPLVSSDALNLPNTITSFRLVLAVVLFILIELEGYWVTSTIFFALAALTDFLDGYIARKYGLVTTLGRILDPFADKIIICGTFVFLLEKQAEGSGVTAWMVVTVIGREMFVTSLRGFLEGEGIDFSASWSGKIKMGAQCAAVPASLLSMHPALLGNENFLILRDILLWGAVAITVWSGLVYLWRGAILIHQQAKLSPPGNP